jgi:hypothetical protein
MRTIADSRTFNLVAMAAVLVIYPGVLVAYVSIIALLKLNNLSKYTGLYHYLNALDRISTDRRIPRPQLNRPTHLWYDDYGAV